ncbi:MAG: hypothetical protein ACK56F_22290, partial [bacterium]
MRHHVEHHVDVLLGREVGDEADALAVRHGPREGLREGALEAAELDDARLLVAVRAEMGGIVIDRLLHRHQHLVYVVGMPCVVIHFQVDSFVHPLLHRITGRHEGVEIHGGMIQFVLEIIPPVLLPLLSQGTWRNAD